MSERAMKNKVVFEPYDMDTGLATNNSGVLMFGPSLEDIDTVSSVISGGDSGGSNAPVYNAQDSVLWCNVRDAFRGELTQMYRNLRAGGIWSYRVIKQLFEDHQKKWPEAVFNEDAWIKYIIPLVDPVTVDESTGELIRTARYLTMLQGSKAEQRKWWLWNRFRYLDSKYNTGDASANVINIRLFNSGTLSITPAVDLYVGVSFGGGTTPAMERTSANVPAEFVYVMPTTVTEMETWIYSADLITDVGDLSVFYPNECDFSKATRLKRLKIGDSSPGYSNANFVTLDVRNCGLLESIDCRNCPQLRISIDLENSPRLTEAYFENTAITGVELTDGGAIETLHLPASITTLTLLNLKKLTDFVLPSYANISQLMLANMSNDVINPVTVLNAIRANSQVNIQGLDISFNSLAEVEDFYDLLDTMKGVTRDRNSNGEWSYHVYDQAQVSGTIHVPSLSTDQMRTLQSRYSNIRFEADNWTYRVRFYDGDTLLHTEQVAAGSNATDPVAAGTIPTPEKASVGRQGYTYSGWDGALTNVQSDLDLHTVFTETYAYQITFKNWDDTVLLTKLIPEGQTCPDPVQTGEIPIPTRPGNANYVYSFLGWTGGGLINVTNDRTLTAAFSEVQSYTIRFLNYDNSVLLTIYLQKNAQIPNPVQAGLIETPVRDRDTNYEYVFSKWSNAGTDGFTFGTVSANKDFTAQYTSVVYYRYIFKDWDGTVLLEEIYHANDTVTDPITDGRIPEPAREPEEGVNYFFWKWGSYTFPRKATAHVTATATYHTDVIHTVTFVNYDSSVLDIQYVQDGSDAVDPITSGRIATPLRPSTAANEYTFSKWNTTFTGITADKTVTATYTSATRSYYVTFMDGSTELARALTVWSKTAEYPGWPVNADDPMKYLTTWNPVVYNVQADVTTYATWAEANITDSWEEIFAAELDGTYKTKYQIGDIKLLDLGNDGIVPMRIVAFDKDVLADGSGYAPITWLAVTAPSSRTTSIILPSLRTQNNKVKENFVERTDDDGTYYRTTFTSSTRQARGQFTITANEDAEFTVRMYGRPTSDGSMMLFENDIPIYVIIDTDGESRDFTYSLSAGESIRLTGCFTLNKSGNSNNYGMIRFFTDDDITVELENLAVLNSAQEQVYSWAESYLRIYLSRYFLPRLPEVVRNNLKLVTKYSATTKTPTEEEGFVVTQDKLWVPSKTELNAPASYTDFVLSMGPKYSDFFDNTVVRQDPKRYFYRKGVQSSAFLRDMLKGDADYSWDNAFAPGNGQLQNEIGQSVNGSCCLMLGFCT